METPFERCENCSKTIGKLEPAHLYNGHVVCVACAATLAAQPLSPSSRVLTRATTPVRPTPPVYVGIQNVTSAAPGTSGFGVAALVIGIVASLFCWVPFAGLLSIPLAGIGVLFGLTGIIVSVAGKRSGVGIPIAGTSLCGVAICVAILSPLLLTAGAAAVAGSAAKRIQAAQSVALANATPKGRSPANPTAISFTPAAEPLRVGDAELRIVSARVGKIQLGQGRETANDLLSLVISIRNTGSTTRIQYSTWQLAAFGLGGVTLKDEFGNRYKLVQTVFDPVGRTSHAVLNPTESCSDLLVFERPIQTAKVLRLEMPGARIGAQGIIRFEIPVAMLQ